MVVVACLALASRLRPDLFPAAYQTASFLPGAAGRLGWPLNYWNALAALMALGLPLLLAIATSARTLWAQAAAAAAVPVVTLCGYLTFSRGGAVSAAAGLLAFLLLSPERVGKLATIVVTAAGSATLILASVHRPAIEQGLTNAAAHHQGDTLVVAMLLVCAGVALAQTGVGLAVRHGTPPRWLTPTPARARGLLAAGLAVCLVAALLAGAPARISHAWQDFKHTGATAALRDDSIARFGTASGNGRYTYWKVAIDATSGHLLAGNGGGTFQLLWDPRAPYYSPVENAHSLYVETLAETGVVGLALLGSFFLLVLGAAVMLCRRSRYEARARAAGLTGALIAFTVGAAADWLWQVPVLPAAFLLFGRRATSARGRPGTEARTPAAAARRDRRRDRGAGCRRGSPRDRQHGARKPGRGFEAAIRPARSPTRAPRSASSRTPPRRGSSSRSCSSSRAMCPVPWRLPRRPRPTNRTTGARGSSSRVWRPRLATRTPRSRPTFEAARSTPNRPCSVNDPRASEYSRPGI